MKRNVVDSVKSDIIISLITRVLIKKAPQVETLFLGFQ